MHPALARLAHDLEYAQAPEEIFGNGQVPQCEQAAAVRASYHRLARIAHPDAYHTAEEQALAHRAFQKLTEWLALAETLIAAEAYGSPDPASRRIVLKTQHREYLVAVTHITDGIYNAYPCQYRRAGRHGTATLKVVRDPGDNDRASNEARILNCLQRGSLARSFAAYFPHLLETFTYMESGASRLALVLEAQPGGFVPPERTPSRCPTGSAAGTIAKHPAGTPAAQPGWYSLEEVRAAYPSGVDPKDMAWIWRRLLVALGFAHLTGVLHRAVLPENVWIHPEQHGLQLRDWTQALNLRVDAGAPLGSIPPGYSGWYPNDARSGASTRTDIVLAAKSMYYILGGDPQINHIPHTVPQPIAAFLHGSTLPGKGAPQDAWALKEEFDELLDALWGERKFHPFTMPTQFNPKEVHHG